jgi:hypothetical protein
MKILISLVISFLLIFPLFAYAARPLSTDDAATVEKGDLEVELGFEYADDADTDDTEDEYSFAATVKYGLTERWDLGVEIPYLYIERESDDDDSGLGDYVFSSKYRFVDESENFPALALGFSLKTKTGDEDKGLGTGELDYTLNTILTKALGKIVTNVNLGYTYVGAPEGENHDDVFSYGLALEYPATEKLNLVGELTGETNFEGDFDDHPFGGLVGFNYAFSENIVFDLGFGWGISEASPDYLVTSGLTLAF